MSKIAPHEGNELDMLLAGTKVFAVLERDKHRFQINRYYSMYNTKFDCLYHEVFDDDLLLCRTAGIPQLVLYKALFSQKYWYVETFGIEDYQRKMGKIFGYSDEEIEEFINNPPDCNCGKCGG